MHADFYRYYRYNYTYNYIYSRVSCPVFRVEVVCAHPLIVMFVCYGGWCRQPRWGWQILRNFQKIFQFFSRFLTVSYERFFEKECPKSAILQKCAVYIYEGYLITITKTITITRATLPIPSTRQPVFVRLPEVALLCRDKPRVVASLMTFSHSAVIVRSSAAMHRGERSGWRSDAVGANDEKPMGEGWRVSAVGGGSERGEWLFPRSNIVRPCRDVWCPYLDVKFCRCSN